MQKNFKDLVLDRRTIRQFLPDPVTDEDICEIISTATHACNSANEQHWQFIVIRSDNIKKRMAEIVRKKAAQLLDGVAILRNGERPTYDPPEFYLQAPVVLAVATAEGKYRSKPDLLMLEAGYSEAFVNAIRSHGELQTLGAAIQLMLLAAWEKGLGGCWMTGPLFARKELEALLGIAGGDILAALVPIGRPVAVPARRERKAPEKVLRFA
jgi:nitroreductase